MPTTWTEMGPEDFGPAAHPRLFDMPRSPSARGAALLAEPGTLFAPERPSTFYVVPCSAKKLTEKAPAYQLYTGSMFRHTFDAAEAAARRDGGRVLILSARHGLVDPERELAPYEAKMGTVGSVWNKTRKLAEQAREFGIAPGVDVVMMLPTAYRTALEPALALLDVYPADLYEGCRGIGEQRRANWLLMQEAHRG